MVVGCWRAFVGLGWFACIGARGTPYARDEPPAGRRAARSICRCEYVLSGLV